MSNIERCWIATEPRWKGQVTGRHVIFEIEVDDYRRQGWTVEGPFVPEQPQGAVDALHEAIQLARDFNRGAMTWQEYDRKLAALETAYREENFALSRQLADGEPPCVCTDAGEDPQCPIHGYEAVIRRLREENERLTDDHQGAVETVDWLREELKRLEWCGQACPACQDRIIAALDRLGGQ